MPVDTDDQTAEPIKLFWWRSVPNFGDAINRRVVATTAEHKVRWAPPGRATMLAIGSLLSFPRVIQRLSGPLEEQPMIWGSGILSDPGDSFSKVRVGSRCLAVRGPLTAAHLKGFDGALGDAGLLCPQILPLDGPRQGIGYVPHHSQWNEPEKLQALQQHGLTLIDVRHEKPWKVVRQIAACELVISASLHGLVVADAYGIPNIWVAANDHMARQGAFKFKDYFATVGRKDEGPVTLDEAMAKAKRGAVGFDCADGVARAQRDLRAVLLAALGRPAPEEGALARREPPAGADLAPEAEH